MTRENKKDFPPAEVYELRPKALFKHKYSKPIIYVKWELLCITFNGPIDEVCVYNRALSADEIKRLYNMGR